MDTDNTTETFSTKVTGSSPFRVVALRSAWRHRESRRGRRLPVQSALDDSRKSFVFLLAAGDGMSDQPAFLAFIAGVLAFEVEPGSLHFVNPAAWSMDLN